MSTRFYLKIKIIMSLPELLSKQIERWLDGRKNGISPGSTIDIDCTQKEINKLQTQEDRFANAYSKEIISLEKFEEYVKPLRTKIREFEDQIYQANLEKTPKSDILLPSMSEIEAFAEEATQKLQNLSFAVKQTIIRKSIDKIIASRESLQVYGLISLSEIYVILFTSDRYRRTSKRR